MNPDKTMVKWFPSDLDGAATVSLRPASWQDQYTISGSNWTAVMRERYYLGEWAEALERTLNTALVKQNGKFTVRHDTGTTEYVFPDGKAFDKFLGSLRKAWEGWPDEPEK